MASYLTFGQGTSDITGFYQDGREFAVVGLIEDAAVFVDITDPFYPIELGRIEGTPSIWRDLKYWNRYVYIGTEADDGVKVVSVDDPDNPIVVNTITDFTSSHNIHVDADGFLYVVGAADHHIWVYDLVIPEDPVLVGTWEGEYLHDIEVHDNIIYGASGTEDVTVSVSGDQLTMAPALNYYGTATITVTTSDGFKDSSETFLLTVIPVQDTPVAVSDEYSVNEGDGLIVESGNSVLLNDTDADNDTLTAIIETDVAHGTLTLESDGSFTYDHDGSETTSDSFTYRASDEGGLLSEPATVNITINPVNDAPVVSGVTATTDEDVEITIAYSGTDIDNNDALLSYEVVTEPTNGNVLDGVYTPNVNYFGDDSFTYMANDGAIDSDPGTVTLTINPVNDAPTAANGDIELNENTSTFINYLAIVNDIDGDSLTIIIIDSSNYGSIENDIYTPDPGYSGSDLLVFEASDGDLTSNQASITFTVINVNDPPVAFDQDQYLDEDDSTSFELFGSDPDGDDISFNLVGEMKLGIY